MPMGILLARSETAYFTRTIYAHRHKVDEAILLGINGNLSLRMGTPFCRIEKYARGNIQYEGAS